MKKYSISIKGAAVASLHENENGEFYKVEEVDTKIENLTTRLSICNRQLIESRGAYHWMIIEDPNQLKPTTISTTPPLGENLMKRYTVINIDSYGKREQIESQNGPYYLVEEVDAVIASITQGNSNMREELGKAALKIRNFEDERALMPPIPFKGPKEEVNHPQHYGGDTTYETIKVLEAWGLDASFNLGNAVKYLSRAGKKDPNLLRDLKKAQWYLNREIEKLEAAGRVVY